MTKKFLILIIILFSYIQISFAKEPQDINVAFTIDNNYPIFTLLSINSILKNNTSNSNYTFYIVENNLTDKNKKKMENFVKKRNQKIEFININKSLLNQSIYTHEHCEHVTEIGMARIYLPELLPQNVNKVLYLDADTLIISDLEELYNEDLTGYNAGMVLDIDAIDLKYKIYKYKNHYFNSGIILIDLQKARKENSTKQFEDFMTNIILPELNNKDKINKKYKYPDQDLINLVWKGKIKKLPYKWNMQGHLINDEGIIHYISKTKPWIFVPYSYRHSVKIKKLYSEYWDECKDLRAYRYYYALISIFKDYETRLLNSLVFMQAYMKTLKN